MQIKNLCTQRNVRRMYKSYKTILTTGNKNVHIWMCTRNIIDWNLDWKKDQCKTRVIQQIDKHSFRININYWRLIIVENVQRSEIHTNVILLKDDYFPYWEEHKDWCTLYVCTVIIDRFCARYTPGPNVERGGAPAVQNAAGVNMCLGAWSRM